ncbi:MAG: 16S rRNA (uracil(1498)-N(3))-methyltransferase [Candidatus Aminicenantes bacterium]|nr:16S rRNA (uracil(1498)-N(3))-methyltransferase [Candidatus Aminicenantes bacterium]
MTANRFYLSRPSEPPSVVRIEGREHHHLSRVVRIRTGEAIEFFDGRGAVYKGVVESCGPDRTLVRILSREGALSPRTSVTLAMALVRPPVLETVIRAATELAVSAMVFVTTERSVAKLPAVPDLRLKRWKRIALEAAKQCKTGWVPEIPAPRRLEDFLREDAAEVKLFLSERGGEPLRRVVTGRPENAPEAPASVSVLIGPEGGWSAGEDRTIRERGVRAVTLGRSVLRAETAAVGALSLISHFWVI